MRGLLLLLLILTCPCAALRAEPQTVRIATFNVAMGLEAPGQLAAALASVLAGVVGTFVVLKRLVAISGGS